MQENTIWRSSPGHAGAAGGSVSLVCCAGEGNGELEEEVGARGEEAKRAESGRCFAGSRGAKSDTPDGGRAKSKDKPAPRLVRSLVASSQSCMQHRVTQQGEQTEGAASCFLSFPLPRCVFTHLTSRQCAQPRGECSTLSERGRAIPLSERGRAISGRQAVLALMQRAERQQRQGQGDS
eukprot:562077-Rhodomonas_salina.2